MGLVFNGTEIDTIIYNGVQIDTLIYNGVVVYEGFPSYTLIYINNTSGSVIFGESLNIRKNNTDPTNVYLNDTLIETLTTEAEFGQTNWGTSFTVPVGESVIKIEGGSFYIDTSFFSRGIETLPTKLILGKNFVGKLGTAFNSSTSLKEIVCGPNVTEITIRCTALEKITMSEGLQEIGNSCFKDSQLSDVKIPASVTTIGSQAFSGSTVSSIEMETKPVLGTTELKTIDDYAFEGCTNLTSLRIRGNRTQLGYGICESCTGLTDLYIYSVADQDKKASVNSASYVLQCDLNLTIHLKQSIGTIVNARNIFGTYFNYVRYGQACTVVFDII